MKKIFSAAVLLLFVQSLVYCQQKKQKTEDIQEQKISDIIKQMTLEEKVSMCSGASPEMAFQGIKRLNIPNVQCSDGPRGPNRGGPATAFPSGIAFGASWNPELIKQAGEVMGNEARAKGFGVLLGPGNNILRDPLNGRFFEYYTEDPFLNSAITVAAVTGIQSEGVAACLKHYACNNREDNRNFYMSMVNDRTLNEIYLPAYKAAVQQGKVWTIMTSANGVNNEFVSDSKKMLTDKLKTEWDFDGFVLTDWLQTRSTEKAALAGLDVSMPGGVDCGFGKPLLDAVKTGTISVAIIDDKVRRILRIYGRIGLLNGRDLKAGAELNTKAHQLIAREIAEEGMVLLKNEGDLLPLNAVTVRNVLVIGPNADKLLCVPGMGGSSGIRPPFEITPLQGIKNLLGNDKVKFISSADLGGFQLIPQDAIKNTDGGKGFRSTYFVKGNDTAVLKRTDPVVDFMWEMKSPDPVIDPTLFRKVKFEGEIIPPMDGKYTLRAIVNGTVIITHNGEQIAFGDSQQELRIATASVMLHKNEPYELSIEYNKLPGDAAVRLEWELPEVSKEKWKTIDKAVQQADAVIFIGGIDHSMDTEGRDRKDISFPGAQENIINHLSRINKKLITVLINGSPLELGGWLPNVPSVLEAWYPGMEGGTAIADILFGKANPSGRLPFSWPKKLADAPCKVLASENNDVVNYTDSLMVGYRYYDTKKVAPQFPFGYGLSYTGFKYGKLNIVKKGNAILGSVKVKNIGAREGAEVVQVYIKPLSPSVKRPVHELKAFKKLFIKKGSQQEMTFKLDAAAFSYYDEKQGKWKVDGGNYEIQAGSSSRDIRSIARVSINHAMFN